jgi:hypothetical protein
MYDAGTACVVAVLIGNMGGGGEVNKVEETEIKATFFPYL